MLDNRLLPRILCLIPFLLAGLAECAFCDAPDTRPAGASPANTSPATQSVAGDKPASPAPTAEDHLSVTTHAITLHGKPLKYEATAGTLATRDEAGKPVAHFFFVAYRTTPDHFSPSTQPVTFVFNGGPGAAAVWLHLGAIGPMRVALDAEGDPGPPPHRLVENAETWLDATDLVFIDPVGTGYSRPAEGHKGEDFYGVEQDVRSVAEFIRLYVTRYQRWLSPKFLAGESYGTTRAAGLSEYLTDRYGIDLNGIVLVSSVLNFQTISPSEGNDLPFPLYLPTYAAVAMYHHKLADDLQADPGKTRAEVARWALNDYTEALAKGNALTADEASAVARQLSRYTGLSEKFVEQSHLRIDPGAFRKRLLNDDAKVLGRYDARLTAPDPSPAADNVDDDPSYSRYLPVYSAAFNDYVRRELKYETDLSYEALSDRVHPWDFGRNGFGYLNVSESLRSAMIKNPHLKLLVAAGYYDLATPYGSADYTVRHLDLAGEIKQNITQTYYPSGHMLYHHGPSREKLRADVGKMMQEASPTTAPAGE